MNKGCWLPLRNLHYFMKVKYTNLFKLDHLRNQYILIPKILNLSIMSIILHGVSSSKSVQWVTFDF